MNSICCVQVQFLGCLLLRPLDDFDDDDDDDDDDDVDDLYNLAKCAAW